MPKNDIKEIVRQATKRKKETTKDKFISSGCSMLNLALTGNANNGFKLGTIINIVGDEATGKTLLALTSMADNIYQNNIPDYRIIYDDSEAALSFDIENLFGKKTKERIEIKSSMNKDNPCSVTVQDLSRNLLSLVSEGNPFIYICDSLDALGSEEERERYGEKFQAGKSQDGSYKMEKAKFLSEFFRIIVSDLARTESTLIILSQTRDNIGFGSMFKPKVRTGGRSLDFYASIVFWLSVLKQIKTKEKLRIGKDIGFKITKNKYNGKLRECQIPIYSDVGIDETGSMTDFLCENYWKKSGKKYAISDFGEEVLLFQKDIPEWIEENGFDLKVLCQQKWCELEENARVNRKKRFE